MDPMPDMQDRSDQCRWGRRVGFAGRKESKNAQYRFIGWSPKIRRRNLHLIANNTRFLILPWIDVPCLGSYLLAVNRRRLSSDRENLLLVLQYPDVPLHNNPAELVFFPLSPRRNLGGLRFAIVGRNDSL